MYGCMSGVFDVVSFYPGQLLVSHNINMLIILTWSILTRHHTEINILFDTCICISWDLVRKYFHTIKFDHSNSFSMIADNISTNIRGLRRRDPG